jgi:hypothetical protein
MPPKSLEWKRILTSEPKETQRDGKPAAMVQEILTPSTAAGMGAVLQSYEQVYLERERLRNECVELRGQLNRRQIAQNSAQSRNAGPRASDAYELLNQLRNCIGSLQKSIHALETEVGRLKDAQSATAALQAKTPSDGEKLADPAQDERGPIFAGSPKISIAKMVAEWMFARPNAAQIRLVEDALRSQGVRV